MTVPPGEDVQAAVDACPRGGCVLLLPGVHDGPLVLTADREVHVFGRGQAVLRMADGTVLTCEAAVATIDGLIVRREAGDSDQPESGVWIRGGHLRLQACHVSNAGHASITIEGGGDPTVAACMYVEGALAAVQLGLVILSIFPISSPPHPSFTLSLFPRPLVAAVSSLGTGMGWKSPATARVGGSRAATLRGPASTLIKAPTH